MNAPNFRVVKYRSAIDNSFHFRVEMWHIWRWILIKSFHDKDDSFAQREAEELLDHLTE